MDCSMGGGGVTIQKEPGSLNDFWSESILSRPLPMRTWRTGGPLPRCVTEILVVFVIAVNLPCLVHYPTSLNFPYL